MSEVSTRPQKGQTKAAKAVKPAQQMAAPELLNDGTPQPEWVSLALPHIRKLSDLLFNLVDQDEHAPELIQALVAEASDITTSLWSKEYAAGDNGSVWSSLNTVVLMLRAAMRIAEQESPGTIPAVHSCVIPKSIDLTSSIMDAVYAVPNLQRLHALNDLVSMGMRPFRDRPQPPIRRVENFPVSNTTEAHKAGEKGRLLALQCTWDISAISEAVTLLADAIVGDSVTEGLLRCYGTRIMTLNGALMAYLDEDSMTAKDMHHKIFGHAKAFDGGAA